MLTALLAALLMMWMLPAGAGGQPTTTPEEQAAARVQPAMVYLETAWSAYVRDHEGDWLNDGMPYEWTRRCSGFIVNPSGYIVTAGHCVDDGLDYGARWDAIAFGIEEWIAMGWADPEDAPLLEDIAYANWSVEGAGDGSDPDRTVYVAHGRAVSGLATGDRETGFMGFQGSWPARVVEVKPLNQGDVALLKVEASNLPTVQLAEQTAITIGTPVLAVGYPASSDMVTDQTLDPSYKDGKVSSEKTRDGGLLPVYEISAAVSAGMSGGPTVDTEARVIGVNSFSISGEAQQFNFLSPASLVTEMLSRSGVDNESGPIDDLYNQALEAFYAGDYVVAMEGFTQVLDRVASHQMAQEFRAQAATLRDTAPVEPEPAAEVETEPVTGEEPTGAAASGSDGLPWAIIGAGAAGAIIIGLLVVFLLTRRRAATPAASAAATPTTERPVSDPGWVPPNWDAPTVPEPGVTASPPPAPPAEPPCAKCGTVNAAQSRFCSGCGHELTSRPKPLSGRPSA
jgi:serine protease Do